MVYERIQKLRTMRLIPAHSVFFKVRLQLWVVLVVVRDIFVPRLTLPVLSHLVQDLDFVVSRFQVVLCTLLNLDSHVAVVFEIFCQPNRREVAPSKLLDNYIAIQQDFTHVNGVVAANFVVRHAFIFARVIILEELVANNVFERDKLRFFVGCLAFEVDVGYRIADRGIGCLLFLFVLLFLLLTLRDLRGCALILRGLFGNFTLRLALAFYIFAYLARIEVDTVVRPGLSVQLRFSLQ